MHFAVRKKKDIGKKGAWGEGRTEREKETAAEEEKSTSERIPASLEVGEVSEECFQGLAARPTCAHLR